MPIISHIAIQRVTTPLVEPYHLSYGPVSALDSVFCCVQLENGRTGWGESTPLPGYCPSDAEDVWQAMMPAAQAAIGREAEDLFAGPSAEDGFLHTALQTACEEACAVDEPATGLVPLIGLVHGKTTEALSGSLEKARAAGHREFKMKAGIYPAETEASLLRGLQQELRNGEWLRLDANQGLDLRSARVIVAACDPARVRYLEQPLPAQDWNGSAQLASSSPLAIALDESITGLESIDRTAQLSAAKFIKLKWMKQGCAAELRRMVVRAFDHGLQVIFGNGVATVWNGRQEAVFWLQHLADQGLAGEMNGFVKTAALTPGLSLADGHAIVAVPAPAAPYFPASAVTDVKAYGGAENLAQSPCPSI